MKAFTPFFVRIFGSSNASVLFWFLLLCISLGIVYIFFPEDETAYFLAVMISFGVTCSLGSAFTEMAKANRSIEAILSKMEGDFRKSPDAIYGSLLDILNAKRTSYELLFTNDFLTRKFFGRFNLLLIGYVNHSDSSAVVHVIDVAEAVDKRLGSDYDAMHMTRIQQNLYEALERIRQLLAKRKQAIEEKLGSAMRLGDYLRQHLIDLDRYLVGDERVKSQLFTLINRCDRKELLLSAEQLLLMPEAEAHEILEAFLRSVK